MDWQQALNEMSKQKKRKNKSKKPSKHNIYDNDAITKEGTEWAMTVGKPLHHIIILIPKGKCPVQLKNYDIDGVFAWCDRIFFYGRTERRLYAPSALRYWVNNIICSDSQRGFIMMYVSGWLKEKYDARKILERQKS